MSRFFGKLCPVCRSPFGENDDVVVCPDCGTPHHRACYIRLGKCAVSQHHESGFVWNGRLPDEQPEPQQQPQQPTNGAFVPPYGTTQAASSSENTDPHHAEYPGGSPQNNAPYIGQETPPFDPLFGDRNGEPYTNPYVEAYKQMQKMTSDETRGEDGVSAKELSRFVGTAVFHYAQAFSSFRVGIPQYGGSVKKVKTSFNIWAGILSPIQQIYRRMDALGILLLIIQALIAIPEILLFRYNTILAQPTAAMLQDLALISSIISIALMITLSLFGDYIYYKFCVRRIKKIRTEFDDGKAEGYYEALTERGAPSKLRAVIGILATLFVGQLVAVLPFHQFLG